MSNSKKIPICGIPSLNGIKGNEKADTAAKLALDIAPDKVKIPNTDLKPKFRKFFHTRWQQC